MRLIKRRQCRAVNTTMEVSRRKQKYFRERNHSGEGFMWKVIHVWSGESWKQENERKGQDVSIIQKREFTPEDGAYVSHLSIGWVLYSPFPVRSQEGWEILSDLVARLDKLFNDEEVLEESGSGLTLHSLKHLEPKPDLAKARISWVPHQLIYHPHSYNSPETLSSTQKDRKPVCPQPGTCDSVPKPLNALFRANPVWVWWAMCVGSCTWRWHLCFSPTHRPHIAALLHCAISHKGPEVKATDVPSQKNCLPCPGLSWSAWGSGTQLVQILWLILWWDLGQTLGHKC